LNIFDPVNPSIQFGIEKRLINNIDIQGEVGSIIPVNFNPYRNYNPQYNGFKVRGEIRNYLNRNNHKIFGSYFALELYYTKNNYKSEENFKKSTDTSGFKTVYSENININKSLIGLNVKIGYQKQIKEFIIDAYIGIGIKYKIIEHFNRRHPEDIMLTAKNFTMDNMIAGNMADDKGKYLIPNFPINIKIGYVF
jgi:hypothetical protein